MILVSVKTHVGMSYLKKVTWQTGSRNKKYGEFKVTVQVICIVKETDSLRSINECKTEN